MKVTKTYFMLMAADVSRAASFYKGVFGLKPAYESSEWTELTQNGTTVALHGGGGTTAERDTGLGFYVDDIQAACSAVASSGGRVLKQPEARAGEGITLATAVDTEGNRFSIAEPAPR